METTYYIEVPVKIEYKIEKADGQIGEYLDYTEITWVGYPSLAQMSTILMNDWREVMGQIREEENGTPL